MNFYGANNPKSGLETANSYTTFAAKSPVEGSKHLIDQARLILSKEIKDSG